MNSHISGPFITVKVTDDLIITLHVPDFKRAKMLLEENFVLSSELPGPQLLYFLTLLDELTQKIPNLENKKLTDLFANSWRNSSIEYANEFVILANKLKLNN